MPKLAPLRGAAAVSFNDIASYMNVRENHIVAWAGQEIQVKVRPVNHVASEDFRWISPEKRGCLFPNEVASYKDSSIQRVYNEKACRFECKLLHAVTKVKRFPNDTLCMFNRSIRTFRANVYPGTILSRS